jgi:putative membrane protein
MSILARGLVVIVALLHAGFLVLEMFFWSGPVGQRVFAMTPEFAAQSAVLAANQGLYNGFLAAGLLWGASRNDRTFTIFFLLCVIVAGVYGGLTAKVTILYLQAAPALVALLAAIPRAAIAGSTERRAI